jgi:hypothetical protein
MIKVLDELIIVVFELLDAVVIIKDFVDIALLAIEKILNRGTTLASIVCPEVVA